MTAAYLTTDIIVIIVLIVVLGLFLVLFLFYFYLKYLLVFIGMCAFFVHFYWTKIGVAEIWNTAKWSSMRSSVYRTIGRFSQGSVNKFPSQQPSSGVSMYPDDIDDVSYENKPTNPVITSYIRPLKNTSQNPVSIISYNNSATRIPNIHEHYNNRQYDLASMIQKQRF
jgi:hypothetical protein